MPKWRHKARATLTTPGGIGLSVQWRYVGKVKAETLVNNQSLQGDFNFGPGLNVKAYNYFDLVATFAVGDTFNFRLGVNNVFDKQPPFVTSGNSNRSGSNLCPTGPCNGNTYPRHLGCAGSLHICRCNAQLLIYRQRFDRGAAGPSDQPPLLFACSAR